MENQSTTRWIFSTSEITYGGPAVLGGNKVAFYLNRLTGVILLLISLVCCTMVMISVLSNVREKNKKKKGNFKIGFAERLPIYLESMDILWSTSCLLEHSYVAFTHTYPSETLSIIFSVNMWIFVGYRFSLLSFLAGYTYFRVVHNRDINLGRYEWKLHTTILVSLILTLPFLLRCHAFGLSGYWSFLDVNTKCGLLSSVSVTSNTTIMAVCTTVFYTSIRRALKAQRKEVLKYGCAVSKHTNSTDFLTTFVFVSLVLYWPLSIIEVIVTVETYLYGVINWASSLAHSTLACSLGWAHCLAYFHNLRLRKRKLKVKQEGLAVSSSTEQTLKDSDETHNQC